ncbi:MAG: glucose-6-phosphate isomerase [wastewater metagenome]|nr:glucose-6-phosphate isomerase [Candidatus Loosdrechtia aerotolerans]
MGDKKTVHLDFHNMMADSIGPEHGITEEELKGLEPLASQYVKELKDERIQGKLPFLDLPYNQDIVVQILETVDFIKEKFKNLVVLGIGGSALGNIAIHTALNHSFHNLLTDRERNGFPRIFIHDNIDPDGFSHLLDIIKPHETLFNFTTKSGTTVETMSQFLILIRLLRNKLGNGYKDHIITITDSERGTLRAITEREGFQSFSIPAGVGGRYSVLTPVGLFSAAMSGVDIGALLDGAAWVDKACQSDNIWENPALMGAALYFLSHAGKNKNLLIMMSYSSALRGAADWFCQLWAESLGKKFSVSKEIIHTGSTPVKAIGVTDQHSQLQLYMEGPYDKVITFWKIERFINTVPIINKEDAVESGLEYLQGHSLNDLIETEFEGTRLALTEQKRPNCTITLDELSAFTLGQLFYLFELQTAYAGKFYKVNTFDQPGVEAGKINTLALLGKKEFEQRKTEITVQLQKKKEGYRISCGN